MDRRGGSRPSDKGGRVGHPDPEIRGGGSVSKKFFSVLRVSVWSKHKRGDRASGSPGPSPGSATASVSACNKLGKIDFFRTVTRYS